MTAPDLGRFDRSARLHPKRSPGLPPARRISAQAVAAVGTGAATLALAFAILEGAAGAGIAFAVALTVGAIAVAIGIASAAIPGRARLRALREEVRGPGTTAIRCTVDPGESRPVERSAADERRHPSRAYQVLAFVDDGIELHARPAGGPSGTAHIPYSSIDVIVVGTVDFRETAERAILIAGDVDGRRFTAGITPVDESSRWLAPASEDAFLALIQELIRRAAAVDPLPDGATRRGPHA